MAKALIVVSDSVVSFLVVGRVVKRFATRYVASARPLVTTVGLVRHTHNSVSLDKCVVARNVGGPGVQMFAKRREKERREKSKGEAREERARERPQIAPPSENQERYTTSRLDCGADLMDTVRS